MAILAMVVALLLAAVAQAQDLPEPVVPWRDNAHRWGEAPQALERDGDGWLIAVAQPFQRFRMVALDAAYRERWRVGRERAGVATFGVPLLAGDGTVVVGGYGGPEPLYCRITRGLLVQISPAGQVLRVQHAPRLRGGAPGVLLPFRIEADGTALAVLANSNLGTDLSGSVARQLMGDRCPTDARLLLLRMPRIGPVVASRIARVSLPGRLAYRHRDLDDGRNRCRRKRIGVCCAAPDRR